MYSSVGWKLVSVTPGTGYDVFSRKAPESWDTSVSCHPPTERIYDYISIGISRWIQQRVQLRRSCQFCHCRLDSLGENSSDEIQKVGIMDPLWNRATDGE